MPATGLSRVREVIVGAQPSRTAGRPRRSGRRPATGPRSVGSSCRPLLGHDELPARTASPCRASVGVVVTSAACAVPGQSSNPAAVSAVIAAIRRRRPPPCVSPSRAPIRVDVAGTGSGHTLVVRLRGAKGSTPASFGRCPTLPAESGATDSIGQEPRTGTVPYLLGGVTVSAPRTPAVADPVVVAAGTTAADAVAAAGLPTTGPKAIVVVRDPPGRLRDLDWAPDDGHRRRAGRARLARRPQRAAPLDRARARPGRAGRLPRGQAGHRPADRERLLLRLRRRQAVPARTTSTKLEKRMQEIVKAGQRFRRRRFDRLDEARAELADEPFKLELVDVKGDGLDADEVMEVGGGELTIYDNVDPKTDKVCWSRPVPGPAPADHPADRRVQADAHRPPRTGAGRRRTRSCSGCTAPRGRPGTRSRRT